MDKTPARKVCVLLLKAHVDTYTRKDGSVVRAHEDKRRAAASGVHPHGIKSGDPIMFEHPDRGRRVAGTYVGVRDGQSVVRHSEDGEFKVDHNAVSARDGSSAAKDWRDEENWHSRTQGRMATLDDAALRYIIKDANEAAENLEKTDPSSKKAGQYRDEAHYASMELHKRRTKS